VPHNYQAGRTISGYLSRLLDRTSSV
jgi:hypothetical protein